MVAKAGITVQGIQSLSPQKAHYKKSVGDGLYICVASNGAKNWMIRYSVNATQRDFRPPQLFGLKSSESTLSLADAKALAATIRALAKQGIDYQIQRAKNAEIAKAAELANTSASLTVNDLFTAWLGSVRRKDGGAELARLFGKDILPVIGNSKLADLEEHHILEMLRPIWLSGTNRKSVVILNDLKQMFKWGEGRKPWKTVIDNPVLNLAPIDVTSDGYSTTERDRVLTDAEIVQLKQALDVAGLRMHIQVAIWLTLSCCTRIGETVKTEWSHLDLDAGIWRIPAENTKNGDEHTVYLSDFAVGQFSILKSVKESKRWCFPNRDGSSHLCPKAPNKQIKDRQKIAPLMNRTKLNNALVLGHEPWGMHDLRRTGSTLLQQLGIAPHIIERILNHREQNKMARVYQHHDYKQEVTEAWGRLGAHLKELHK